MIAMMSCSPKQWFLHVVHLKLEHWGLSILQAARFERDVLSKSFNDDSQAPDARWLADYGCDTDVAVERIFRDNCSLFSNFDFSDIQRLHPAHIEIL